MSAQLATASPCRIKATHRRRRKIASGRFVQRYYDPQIGVFFSVDPDTRSFNRFAYANNNPYRFIDPDGRAAATPSRRPSGTDSSEPPPPPPPPPNGCGVFRNCIWNGVKWTVNFTADQVADYFMRNVGVVEGAWSVARGNYRGVRQAARSAGLLGSDEAQRGKQESKALDEIVHQLSTNPDARDAAWQGVKGMVRNAPYRDARFQGYVVGRFLTGVYLRPLGVSAVLGDGLQLLEDGVRDPAALMIGSLGGRE